MENIDWNLIKVLVVDDDEIIVKLVSSLLRNLGCTFEIARDSKEAIALVMKYDFDICFMDLMMPNMNGVETTLKIRQECKKELPIIAFTAGSIKANKDKCISAGMNDFLPKPLNVEQLKEMIIRYTAKNRHDRDFSA